MCAISLGSSSEGPWMASSVDMPSRMFVFFIVFFFCRLKCTWRYNCMKKHLLPLAVFCQCEQKLGVNTCLWNCYCCLRATEAFSGEIMQKRLNLKLCLDPSPRNNYRTASFFPLSLPPAPLRWSYVKLKIVFDEPTEFISVQLVFIKMFCFCFYSR